MFPLKQNVTVQGVIGPVPAAHEGVQAGPQSSRSYYRNTSPVAYLAGDVDNTTSIQETVYQNPFGSSGKTMRSPPISTKGMLTKKTIEQTNDDTKRLEILKLEEEKAFAELGKKLSIANAVVINAKNVHKTIRDNLTCATLLYQQLREYRDAIAKYPSEEDSQNKQVLVASKLTQTDTQSEGSNVDGLDNRKKRLSSASPHGDRTPKKQKTSKNTVNSKQEKADIRDSGNAWKTVENRKLNKRNERSKQQKSARDNGEVITVSSKNSNTYAEILKKMKNSIDPNALGVEVQEMRRTKAGELLIKLRSGEGKAKLLKDVIQDTLGENVGIRSITRNCNIDIRDMDESVEEQEILNALMTVTGSQQDSFKILNIRESYGKTKQALVQMPTYIASRVLDVYLELTDIKT